MMNRYIVIKSPTSGDTVGIFDREREAVIPLSSSNSDYAEYLDWLSEGNSPDEPEEWNSNAD
jgi:hypothetical protein